MPLQIQILQRLILNWFHLFDNSLNVYYLNSLLKKNPAQNTIENVFNGYNGNCIGFNGKCNGVYWYVMDSIGGMLNSIGKMPKTHYTNEFCNGFTGKS